MAKLDDLVSFIRKEWTNKWADEGKKCFVDFLTSGEMYRADTYKEDDKTSVAIRNPGTDIDKGVPYIALVMPTSKGSGPYAGTSFVLFPSKTTKGSLVTLCVGTDGIDDDAEALSRPGHARRLRAIADYINCTYGNGMRIAWAKKDPYAIEEPMTESALKDVESAAGASDYEKAIGKAKSYNSVCYFYLISDSLQDEALKECFLMVLHLIMEIRGVSFLKAGIESRDSLESKYISFLFSDLKKDDVVKLLEERKYVIIQGPPGTGKTRLVLDNKEGLKNKYGENMCSVQFHPNMTYERFMGGLFPESNKNGETLGFQFSPKPGILLECIAKAKSNPKTEYLLHIDEINRADLSKVFGEAILLFEHRDVENRKVALDYDFGQGGSREVSMPSNLHVVGTMNTADKSIAPIDIAIRRRFAFVELDPQIVAVKKWSAGSPLACQAFEQLLKIFVDYAPEDSFKYLPGHSYFFAKSDDEFKRKLKTELIPLLKEYLSEGIVSSMSGQIEDYIQSLRVNLK